MAELRLLTDVDGTVAQVLAASLDLGVELEAAARHRIRAVDRGPGSRTGGEIGQGEQVTWAGRLYGVLPFRHTSSIDSVEPDDGAGGAAFVDSMRSGLFASFRHEHRLTPLPSGGTRMTDHVVWRSPLGPLGRAADVIFVRRALRRLVLDRNATIRARFRR